MLLIDCGNVLVDANHPFGIYQVGHRVCWVGRCEAIARKPVLSVKLHAKIVEEAPVEVGLAI